MGEQRDQTIARKIDDGLFRVSEGFDKSKAIDEADLMLHVSQTLMTHVVGACEDGEDVAWAARFLMMCARALHEAIDDRQKAN